MYCQTCGKEISDDSNFCNYCGVKQGTKSNCEEHDFILLSDFDGKELGRVCIYCNEDILNDCCPNCHKPLKFGGSRCSYCGANWWREKSFHSAVKCRRCKSSSVISRETYDSFLKTKKIKTTCLACNYSWTI